MFDEITMAGGLLAALVVALEVGYRVGLRTRRSDPEGGGPQVGAIQGAVLGLLGLLLAFSFAAAGARFLERQDLIVQEANAIGTAYLRADLLAEPHRSELHAALKEYTEHRVAASVRLVEGWDATLRAEVDRMHGRIWRTARDGVMARPDLAVTVLPPVNEVIDLNSTRIGAARKHIPWVVMSLLLACSLLCIAIIGYGGGIDGHRRLPLSLSLTLLIAASLWITVDLDHPRKGLLRLSDAPLQELKFE
jgi:hypothetical protein